MTLNLFALAALIVVGCGEKKSEESMQEVPRMSTHRTLLQGIWWSPDMPQVAAFVVNDTTFYYPDFFLDRKYTLKDDSLFITFDDGYVAASAIVKLNADTLILSTGGLEHVYTRAEPKQ